MSESILDTTKKMLGLDAEYTAFDTDIIVLINSALMTLNQLGVGKKETHVIVSNDSTWEDLIGERTDMEAVKNYVYLKVRLTFDPPSNSFVMDAMQKQCDEILWRLNVRAESEGSEDYGNG